jgi:hypothetical protein
MTTAITCRAVTNKDTMKEIVSFISSEEAKGVTVLFSWPALPQTVYATNKKHVDEQDVEIVSAIGSARVLGTQQDSIFKDDQFFDSIGHLAAAGRDTRTQRFILLLKRWLVNNKLQ